MQVDSELELGRLQHRKLCRLSAIDDAAGISPDLAETVRKVCPLAHSPAHFDEPANSKTGRQSVARCHNGKLNAAACEQRTPADEEGLATLAHHACKGYIDFVAGAGVENMDLQAQDGGGCLHFLQSALGGRSIRRIDQYGNASGVGH